MSKNWRGELSLCLHSYWHWKNLSPETAARILYFPQNLVFVRAFVMLLKSNCYIIYITIHIARYKNIYFKMFTLDFISDLKQESLWEKTYIWCTSFAESQGWDPQSCGATWSIVELTKGQRALQAMENDLQDYSSKANRCSGKCKVQK